MSKDSFKFGESFEKIIVKEIIEATPSFTYWIDYLKENYFSSPSVGYVFHLIKKSQKELEIIPTYRVLRQLVRKEKAPTEERKAGRLEFIKSLQKFKYLDTDRKYALSMLALFIRRQRYIAVISESPQLLKEGNLEDLNKLDSSFRDILNQGEMATQDLGTWYFRNIKDRLFRQVQNEKRYKFLIPELDINLRNEGMLRGETVVWLAPPGTGKTMALVHNTKAWLLQKLKGVYYSFQLLPEDIAERLDATFSGISTSEIRDNTAKIQRKTEQLKKRYGDSLVIKYFPRGKHSMTSVRNHLRLLKDQGFEADFIVIDFLNFMVSEKGSRTKDSNGSQYYEKGDVTSEFISFCQEERILGSAGAQANRVGAKEDIITMAHIAESFGMAMEATLLVSINRNASERASDRGRLFVAKYTFGRDQYVIPISTNYDKGSFYRRG